MAESRQAGRVLNSVQADQAGNRRKEKCQRQLKLRKEVGAAVVKHLQEVEGSLCEAEGRAVQTFHLFQPSVTCCSPITLTVCIARDPLNSLRLSIAC